MKKTVLTAILLSLTIWLQASVNVIIAYTQNDKASEKSSNEVSHKFREIYPDATIGKYADMQSIIKAFEIKSDTLIFYFAGHSNKIDNPKKAEYMGKLVMVLNWKVLTVPNMQDYLLASKSLHYLLSKSVSSKKLVIIDGCYAYNAFTPLINASWLFSTDINKGGIITKDGCLFTTIFTKYLTKGMDLNSMYFLINEEMQDKRHYPEYNDKLVYGDLYLPENPHLYPVNPIVINHFKF